MGGVSPFNMPAQNSAIIAKQTADRFQNRLARERDRELSNIPKGTVKKSISNIFDGLEKPTTPKINLLDVIGSWPPTPRQPPSAGVATKSLFDTEKKTKTQQEIDDFLYEIPDSMPELVPVDAILTSLGTELKTYLIQMLLLLKKKKKMKFWKK